ncbi:MAG: MoxR family ATPase [Candidatus Tectomicrobia bacterium]|nr:MoxR family ATPase [Candidatus Tectomicrobia bacterium]
MIQDKIERLQQNIEKVLIGKRDVIQLVLVGLFSQGHILIEDVPGVGKTTLARALARSIDCTFQRIQFTSDLLPSDILGVSIYHAETGRFEFKPGPIFAHVILTDEVNRATPRTQSSLLEAMNDFQVSIDGITHKLPRPFIVMATQNPIEYEGTYPLPESQLDRFLMKLKVGYPNLEDEKRILASQRFLHPLEALQPVLTVSDVVDIEEMVKQVTIDESLVDYILAIVHETRHSDRLEVGVSPRGSFALFRAAQAIALINGREYCIPDDIKDLAIPVLSHRIIIRSTLGAEREKIAEQVIEDILMEVKVPM